MKVIIPSRGRAKTIAKHTLALFPDAIVTVDEREIADYAPVCKNLLPHPPLPGISAIRNWILDNVPDETFVMADDDVLYAYSKVGKVYRKYRSPADAMRIIENAGECAHGIGASLFGFTQAGTVLSFKPQDPLAFSGWIGTIIGVVGRQVRYNEQLAIGSEDIDVSLRELLERRIVFIDNRFFWFSTDRLRSSGGNAHNRSLERELKESEKLKQIWGDYVSVGFKDQFGVKSNVRVKSIHVSRRQAKA